MSLNHMSDYNPFYTDLLKENEYVRPGHYITLETYEPAVDAPSKELVKLEYDGPFNPQNELTQKLRLASKNHLPFNSRKQKWVTASAEQIESAYNIKGESKVKKVTFKYGSKIANQPAIPNTAVPQFQSVDKSNKNTLSESDSLKTGWYVLEEPLQAKTSGTGKTVKKPKHNKEPDVNNPDNWEDTGLEIQNQVYPVSLNFLKVKKGPFSTAREANDYIMKIRKMDYGAYYCTGKYFTISETEEVTEEYTGTETSTALVERATSICMEAWYSITKTFNTSHEKYNTKTVEPSDQFMHFKLAPSLDVRDDAYSKLIKACEDLASKLNDTFGRKLFEPEVERKNGTLHCRTSYIEGTGGLFQAKSSEGDISMVLNLTMPKQQVLRDAFKALVTTPKMPLPDDDETEGEMVLPSRDNETNMAPQDGSGAVNEPKMSPKVESIEYTLSVGDRVITTVANHYPKFDLYKDGLNIPAGETGKVRDLKKHRDESHSYLIRFDNKEYSQHGNFWVPKDKLKKMENQNEDNRLLALQKLLFSEEAPANSVAGGGVDFAPEAGKRRLKKKPMRRKMKKLVKESEIDEQFDRVSGGNNFKNFLLKNNFKLINDSNMYSYYTKENIHGYFMHGSVQWLHKDKIYHDYGSEPNKEIVLKSGEGLESLKSYLQSLGMTITESRADALRRSFEEGKYYVVRGSNLQRAVNMFGQKAASDWEVVDGPFDDYISAAAKKNELLGSESQEPRAGGIHIEDIKIRQWKNNGWHAPMFANAAIDRLSGYNKPRKNSELRTPGSTRQPAPVSPSQPETSSPVMTQGPFSAENIR